MVSCVGFVTDNTTAKRRMRYLCEELVGIPRKPTSAGICEGRRQIVYLYLDEGELTTGVADMGTRRELTAKKVPMYDFIRLFPRSMARKAWRNVS